MGTDLTGNEDDDKKGPARRERSHPAGLGNGPRPRDRAKNNQKGTRRGTHAIGQPIAAQFHPQRNSMNVEAAAL